MTHFSMVAWLFYSVCYNPVFLLFNILFKMAPVLAIGALLFGSYDLWHIHINVGFGLGLFCSSPSLLLGTTKSSGSSCVFPTQFLGSVIHPRSLGSSYWGKVLETRSGHYVLLIASGVLFLLGPFSWQSKKYVCLYWPMNIYISLHISTCNHLRLH